MYSWLLILGKIYTSSEILYVFLLFFLLFPPELWSQGKNLQYHSIYDNLLSTLLSSGYRKICSVSYAITLHPQLLNHWNIFFQSFFHDPMYFSIHFTVNDKSKTLQELLCCNLTASFSLQEESWPYTNTRGTTERFTVSTINKYPCQGYHSFANRNQHELLSSYSLPTHTISYSSSLPQFKHHIFLKSLPDKVLTWKVWKQFLTSLYNMHFHFPKPFSIEKMLW